MRGEGSGVLAGAIGLMAACGLATSGLGPLAAQLDGGSDDTSADVGDAAINSVDGANADVGNAQMDVAPRPSDGGDACAPDPSWCKTRCGTGTDPCGRFVTCPACTGGICYQGTCCTPTACNPSTCQDNCGRSCCDAGPGEAGCGTGACNAGPQCCTGYCGSAGTCVSSCGLSAASCTALAPNCCYGLSCKAGFPPVVGTCQ